jgi:hypothetical protein
VQQVEAGIARRARYIRTCACHTHAHAYIGCITDTSSVTHAAGARDRGIIELVCVYACVCVLVCVCDAGCDRGLMGLRHNQEFVH